MKTARYPSLYQINTRVWLTELLERTVRRTVAGGRKLCPHRSTIYLELQGGTHQVLVFRDHCA
jgi:hypothetical protein